MGLHEILGPDYGIEKPYWGPSEFCDLKFPGLSIMLSSIRAKNQTV